MLSKPKHEFKDTTYIPALGHSFLTPFYDFMMKWAARESAFKPRLVEQMRIRNGYKVLDLGCGTATLTLLIKKNNPDAEVVGLDGDPKMLEIAKTKIAKEGLNIKLDYGVAYELPYPDEFFDRVVASMVLHHLTRENKLRSLREILRILKPDRELHIADLGKPQNVPTWFVSLVMRNLEESMDNVKGLLPEMCRLTGFEDVRETARFTTAFGTIALHKARNPVRNNGIITVA